MKCSLYEDENKQQQQQQREYTHMYSSCKKTRHCLTGIIASNKTFVIVRSLFSFLSACENEWSCARALSNEQQRFCTHSIQSGSHISLAMVLKLLQRLGLDESLRNESLVHLIRRVGLRLSRLLFSRRRLRPLRLIQQFSRLA